MTQEGCYETTQAGFVEFGLDSDSNANSGPDIVSYDIGAFNVTLDVNFEVTEDIDLVEVNTNQSAPTSVPSGFEVWVLGFIQGLGSLSAIVSETLGIVTSNGVIYNQILLDTNELGNGLFTVVGIRAENAEAVYSVLDGMGSAANGVSIIEV